jgi:AraC-like DNA-binding protein
LLGVPAAEVRGARVPLKALRPDLDGGSLMVITERMLGRGAAPETTPWSLPLLHDVTRRLGEGATVRSLADEIGWSARNLQRQCVAVYGYGPATLRRILRFRKAVGLLRDGASVAATAAAVGYADQSHLHRQVRDLAGVPVSQVGSAANRSTDVPSGSTTVA